MDNLKKRTWLFFLGLAISLFLIPFLEAQQTFKTTIYFDYTSDLSSNGYLTGAQARKDLNNQFLFRRAYFTYENKINDNLKFRFRYDADTVNSIDKNSKADDKFRPFVKHIFLDWTGPFSNSSLKVGMIETITFSNIAEKKWGYRSVAKTLLDGYKDVTGKEIDATSADLGASLIGTLSKEIRYGFMVSNGSAYSHPEKDKYKKFMAQLHLVPLAGLSLVGYVDYEKQKAKAEAWTYKADAYYEMIQGLILGGEIFSYDNDLNLTSEKKQYKS